MDLFGRNAFDRVGIVAQLLGRNALGDEARQGRRESRARAEPALVVADDQTLARVELGRRERFGAEAAQFGLDQRGDLGGGFGPGQGGGIEQPRRAGLAEQAAGVVGQPAPVAQFGVEPRRAAGAERGVGDRGGGPVRIAARRAGAGDDDRRLRGVGAVDQARARGGRASVFAGDI
ncbi:hypothetical protein FE772_03835 [Lysobacter enzymogenes]|nr:hypothetical protein FE772_03835 [Lysobacter enzymogenes]